MRKFGRKKIIVGGLLILFMPLILFAAITAILYLTRDKQPYEIWSFEDFYDLTAVAKGWHFVGLKSDGTVVAVGDNRHNECDVGDWHNIVAIAAGDAHTVGLKSDGTVVAVGSNRHGQCNVSGWTDIIAISAGKYHTIGLKSDGTVVAAGDNSFEQCNVNEWSDIVAISTGHSHTVGLKSDGTVVTTGNFGNFNREQHDVSEWSDIVAVSAGYHRTMGLKSDGTAVVVGLMAHDISGWNNLISVNAGHTIGLKSNGTIITAYPDSYFLDTYNPMDWCDIIEIATGTRDNNIVGLKSDGTIEIWWIGKHNMQSMTPLERFYVNTWLRVFGLRD
jgi:hypothetical protein